MTKQEVKMGNILNWAHTIYSCCTPRLQPVNIFVILTQLQLQNIIRIGEIGQGRLDRNKVWSSSSLWGMSEWFVYMRCSSFLQDLSSFF
jgi:hypothetical protein